MTTKINFQNFDIPCSDFLRARKLRSLLPATREAETAQAKIKSPSARVGVLSFFVGLRAFELNMRTYRKSRCMEMEKAALLLSLEAKDLDSAFGGRCAQQF